MPTLSLTQLILTLWLAAAVAPAASALLQSALGALGPERAQSLAGGLVGESVRAASVRARTPATRQAPKGWNGGVHLAGRDARAQSAGPGVDAEIPTASVLHTGVQRHRPRLA